MIAVSDGDAIRMAQRLARELGLGVGISSGANLIGALIAAAKRALPRGLFAVAGIRPAVARLFELTSASRAPRCSSGKKASSA